MPTNSLALGLGEIEVNSFLNQPLNAEIEVISARAGEIDDLLVSLASREAFTRAGLERPRHLSDLRFTVRKSEEGDKAVIIVSTKSAVKEPFLNFLIEADWSKGRVLREFTILLDPPFYADTPAPAPAETQAEAAISDESTVSEILDLSPTLTPTETDAQITEPIALSDTASTTSSTSAGSDATQIIAQEPEPEPLIEGDIQIDKGDTLWSIASRYKDADHSMAQVMLAFQRSNPGAFNNENINNMKLGAVLRVPTAYEFDAVGNQEAYARVLEQNGLWDDYVARVTGTSPSVAAQGSDGGVSSEQKSGELSLLLPGDGDTASSGISDGTAVSELRTKLALAEEELDASRIENKELESRIAELQARLSKVEELQKMVEIEDDSLAQLQAKQDQSVVESSASSGKDVKAPDTSIPVTEEMKADEKALLEELLAEEAAAQAEEQQAAAAGSDKLAEDKTAESEDTLVDQTTSQNLAPPVPMIVTEPVVTSGSMFDGILPPDIINLIPSLDSIIGDPIILGAVGGVILLLLILLFLKRRKSSSVDSSSIMVSEADDMFGGDDEEELTPIHLAEAVEMDTHIKLPSAADMAKRAPVENDDFSKTAVISKADMPEPEAPVRTSGTAEQDDVLNEVDVYLAYGLYDNAEDLLKSSLTDNPDRADYRSKLLDTYFATKNVTAYVGEAKLLKSMGDAGKRYWDRVQVMGYELAPDNSLFSDAKDSGLSAADLEIAKPQAADFDLGSSEDDDTNFSSTDFNLGEEAGSSDFSDTHTFGDTQIKDSSDITGTHVLPSLDVAAASSLELPDDIGEELQFSLGDDDDALALDLDMPDSLDLGADNESNAASTADDLDLDDIGLAFDADEEVANDDEEIDFSVEFEGLDYEESPQIEKTAIVDTTPGWEETSILKAAKLDAGKKVSDKASLDLGMDDTSLMAVVGDDDDDVVLGLSDEGATDDDISIVDFGGDDFAMDDERINVEDTFSMDIDMDESGDTKTGTFAPGDFDEPTGAVDSISDIDDIGDLMLPDDVDEVSTKLDLARAFIDMGDTEGARSSLEEVMSEGNEEQKAEAKALLKQI